MGPGRRCHCVTEARWAQTFDSVPECGHPQCPIYRFGCVNWGLHDTAMEPNMNIQVQGHGIYNHGFKRFFEPAVDVWGQSIQILPLITVPLMKTPPRTTPCLGLPSTSCKGFLLPRCSSSSTATPHATQVPPAGPPPAVVKDIRICSRTKRSERIMDALPSAFISLILETDGNLGAT